ncbi:MAG: hypothetical protein JW832_15030 [Deltaproteobacteria bacterium]|nr:hypothetical protein [Deltaproteobacteria bacterium]
MAGIPTQLKKNLLSIIKKDYEECQFYMASTNMLIHKIQNIAASLEKDSLDFNTLRDEIGEVGLFVSNAEKRLLEVEECYTKLVEALADGKPNS